MNSESMLHTWERNRRLRGMLRKHMVEEGIISREEARQLHAMEHGLFGNSVRERDGGAMFLNQAPGDSQEGYTIATGSFFTDVIECMKDMANGIINGSNALIYRARGNMNASANQAGGPIVPAARANAQSQQMAKNILTNNITLIPAQNGQQIVSDFWILYRDAFMPREFGGKIIPNAGALHPTFSVAYIESLRNVKEFKQIAVDKFISTAAFVDLARCPVVFCMNRAALAILLMAIYRFLILKTPNSRLILNFLQSQVVAIICIHWMQYTYPTLLRVSVIFQR
jgi:hypothetical protein